VRIDCLSDTHGHHDALGIPEGDVLVHAGDATLGGTAEEVTAFARWFRALPHPHKVFVAGNHDRLFEDAPLEAGGLLGDGIVYLRDSGTTIGGQHFWGSPWQPWFLDYAFNLRRGEPLRAKWSLIPGDTDVLITHGPPRGIRDRVGSPAARLLGRMLGQGPHVGCNDLRAAVARLRPRLHVFGHIHEGYGRETADGTLFVNAANVDAGYHPVNPAVVVDL
jgi:Icc-related predicted phosphoesterase